MMFFLFNNDYELNKKMKHLFLTKIRNEIRFQCRLCLNISGTQYIQHFYNCIFKNVLEELSDNDKKELEIRNSDTTDEFPI